MQVLIFTLTRDRIEYTKRMFEQLKNCGVEYDHVVVDNGSKDGTLDWLVEQDLYDLCYFKENRGLWAGIQTVIDVTSRFYGYDYVVKVDNDMEFPEDGWLKKMIERYEENDFDILSPFVNGICSGQGGVRRVGYSNGIGIVPHVGGAALLTTPEFYDEDLPTDRPLAQGWDTWFCTGLKCGIVEDIKVKHDTKKQEKTMKKYYKRKIKESKYVV
jgi:glycosyltransferase involved in cell wall biosynthesis